MDEYVAKENIKHFKEKLGTESDLEKRKTLLRLLSLEDAKLKAISEAALLRSK